MITESKKLAEAVYRLTKLFPEGEVLISQIRQSANRVLEAVILNKPKEALLQIEVLLSFLEIAQGQNWLKEINFIILKKEYLNLKNKLSQPKKVVSKSPQSTFKLSQRQEQIVVFAKKRDRFQLKDLAKQFPDLNRRTLIRDLEGLCKSAKLTRFGRGRGLFYKKI